MASDVFSLMGALSSLINWAIFLMVGVLGVIVVTVFLYLYYLKTEKVQGILWDAILHTVFSLFFGFQMIGLGDSLQGLGGNQTFTTIMGILVFASALSNFFGGRSATYENELLEARENALKELEERAYQKGANAIVGIDVDYEVLGADNGMLMVTVSGTAVVVQ